MVVATGETKSLPVVGISSSKKEKGGKIFTESAPDTSQAKVVDSPGAMSSSLAVNEFISGS